MYKDSQRVKKGEVSLQKVQDILEEMKDIESKQRLIKKEADKMKRQIIKIRIQADYLTHDKERQSEHYVTDDKKVIMLVKDAVLTAIREEYFECNNRMKALIDELKEADTDEV